MAFYSIIVIEKRGFWGDIMLQDFKANDFISELKAIDLLMLSKELDNTFLSYRDTLNLTRGVRFGVEIEYEGVSKEKTEEFLKKNNIMWRSIDDETLDSGGEIVSPRLIDERKTWENLKSICQFLKANRADTCHNAGLHIHVGAHLLGDKLDAWRRLAKLYTVYERVLMRFGYGDKLNPRSTLFLYARPVGLHFLEKIHDLDTLSLYSVKNFFKSIYDIKKNAINLRSLEFLGAVVNLNTLEFRNFNATTEESVIQNDINTACRILLAAKSKDLDEDFLDFKIKQLEKSNISEVEYFNQCSQILLREMAELVDLIFDNNQDKIYFMRQYIKGFDSSSGSEVAMARGLVK